MSRSMMCFMGGDVSCDVRALCFAANTNIVFADDPPPTFFCTIEASALYWHKKSTYHSIAL